MIRRQMKKFIQVQKYTEESQFQVFFVPEVFWTVITAVSSQPVKTTN